MSFCLNLSLKLHTSSSPYKLKGFLELYAIDQFKLVIVVCYICASCLINFSGLNYPSFYFQYSLGCEKMHAYGLKDSIVFPLVLKGRTS